MKHLKKNIISNISSNNNIVSKNSKNYADFGQKKKPCGLTVKKNRLFKSLGIGAMAVFMGILTVLGTACTPTQTNTNLENGSLASGNKTEAVQSAPSPLGLDPQNDPIIYTTESGLEIKYGGIDYGGTLESGNLKGWHYITMGKYNNNDINWVIMNRNSNMSNVDFIDPSIKQSYAFTAWKQNAKLSLQKFYMQNINDTSTPAGSAINSSLINSFIVDDSTKNISLSSVPVEASDYLPNGCVLVFSEGILGTCQFNSIANTEYPNSILKTKIDALHTTLFTDEERKLIQLVKNLQSRTKWESSGNHTYTYTDAYLFPNAVGTEGTTRITNIPAASNAFHTSSYWTRSGSGTSGYVNICTSTGYQDVTATATHGIRPLMVVSLL